MRRNRLASLPAGHLVATYRIRSVLWRNGFEVIYFGNEVRTGQDVVVREYCPNDFARRKGGHVSPARPANEDNFNIGLREFFAEAEAFARQPLSAIVPTIDIFVANGTAYVVAPFAVGKRLELSLRSGPTPSTTAEIEAMFVPILDAMEAIHSAGIVHCDLCPETILFDDSGAPQLIGFSGARHRFKKLTQAPSILPRPGYSPLELYASAGEIGPWTDIYSLGAVLYRRLFGAPPPEAPDRALLDAALPVQIDDWRAGFRQGLESALGANSAARPQTISQWRSILSMKAPSEASNTADVNNNIAVVRSIGLSAVSWQRGRDFVDAHPILQKTVAAIVTVISVLTSAVAFIWRQRRMAYPAVFGLAGLSILIGVAAISLTDKRTKIEVQPPQIAVKPDHKISVDSYLAREKSMDGPSLIVDVMAFIVTVPSRLLAMGMAAFTDTPMSAKVEKPEPLVITVTPDQQTRQ